MKRHKPSFTSDQLALLGPLVTPAAVALARRRLIHDRERITAQCDKGNARIALLLVRTMHPDLYLTNTEEGILRGLDPDTIGKMKARGEM